MTRMINLVAVFGPFVALAVAIPLLWGDLVGPSDVVAFGVMYLHRRVRRHRRVITACSRIARSRRYKPVEYTLAIMGSLAVQGSPIEWVADHRKHHAHTDVEGDPHSPHVGHGSGVRGALRGLWHSHVGWLFETQGQAKRPHSTPRRSSRIRGCGRSVAPSRGWRC